MAETKDEITAQRDALRAENDELRAKLAAAATAAPAAAVHRFQLCEGDRAELEAHGVATIGGKAMTADAVRALLAETDDQRDVFVGAPAEA